MADLRQANVCWVYPCQWRDDWHNNDLSILSLLPWQPEFTVLTDSFRMEYQTLH